jgi:DNA mismatch endonuclease (patch repair protein)
VDKLSIERRRENMRQIRSTNTRPEKVLRQLLHRSGYRFRLHCKDLPGKPDLVFRSRKKIILLHGCFWHQHPGCREGRVPGSRPDYWGPKLAKNIERDAAHESALAGEGWSVLVIWECELKSPEEVLKHAGTFLGPPGRGA